MQYFINTPKFAYIIGYFVADGTLYRDSKGLRFEFCDGSSIKEELHYSYEFLSRIGLLFKELTGVNINIRQRGNKYVLSFRNKKFAEYFIKVFSFRPGKKAKIVDVPLRYRATDLEKYFWLGVMDGDGMVARNSRKIAIESVSSNLIRSFCKFLDRSSIKYTLIDRQIKNTHAFGIRLSSAFFSEYAQKLGFLHPRKKKWLKEHLRKNEFYTQNDVLLNNFLIADGMIDYSKIFETPEIFIVDGKSILQKYKLPHQGCPNKSFINLFSALLSKGLSKIEISRVFLQYKWKMSKGSTSQVKLPLRINDELFQLAKIVRIYAGQVRISKAYTRALKIDYDKGILDFERLFETKAHYSNKNEAIFSSGVLEKFFSKVIKRRKFEVSLPEWHKELL